MALSNKQQVFINEYLISWNATDAARRAGYAYPNVEGPKNLVNPSIQSFIVERLKEKQLTADAVLSRLAEMAFSNMSDFAYIQTNADLANARERGYLIKKFKRKITTRDDYTVEDIELELYDAQSALEKIGKHLSLFIDKVEHSGPDGGPIQFTEVIVELPPDDTLED
jgi:phage terminase small subunit